MESLLQALAGLPRRGAVMAAGTGVEPDLDLARARCSIRLRAQTSVGRGITRATYGEGENSPMAWRERRRRGSGLEIRTDAALNLYMTLPGHGASCHG